MWYKSYLIFCKVVRKVKSHFFIQNMSHLNERNCCAARTCFHNLLIIKMFGSGQKLFDSSVFAASKRIKHLHFDLHLIRDTYMWHFACFDNFGKYINGVLPMRSKIPTFLFVFDLSFVNKAPATKPRRIPAISCLFNFSRTMVNNWFILWLSIY